MTTSTEDEIKELKERLQEAEQNCRQAAEFGKALLEENIQLKTDMDDGAKQYSTKLEALEQENYSQTLKGEAHDKEKKWFDDEMSQIKNELQAQKQNLIDQFDIERSQEGLRYKKQINELKSDYDQAQSIEKQLKDKVRQLDELLQQQLEQTQVTSRSFYGDEINDMEQELIKLQADNTGLTAQMIDAHTELKCAQDTCSSLKAKLAMKDEEIQEIQCHMTSYCNNIEKLKVENGDLSAQLEALRIEANAHNSKGNSIFSEVEDRRVEAEKKLKSLRERSDYMKEKLEQEKQLHHKSKTQMLMLLNMSTGRCDNATVTRLHTQLAEARSTVKELLEKLDKYENSEKLVNVTNLADIESKVQDGDKNYVQYLITMLKTKEAEVTEVKYELRHKNLQLLDVSNKLLTQEKTVVDLQKKQDVVRGQNMKLALMNEGLLIKYDPEHVQKNKKQLFTIEKIPLLTDDNDKPELKLVEKHCKPSSDVSRVSAPYLSESKKLNIPTGSSHDKVHMPFRKTVSISTDMAVVSPDGNIENKCLPEDREDMCTLKLKAAKTPKEPKIKQVKVQSENVHECKSQ